jgi:hypothetical protein
MKRIILLFSVLFSIAAQARESDVYDYDNVETTITELAPEIASRPPSTLPDAPRVEAPYFKGERFQTSLGTLTLRGGFIGEGNNYKLTAEFTCKNGKTLPLFKDLRFCEFRSVANPVKGSFEVVGQKIRFHYLATKKPDFSGMTSCSGPTFKEVAVDCTVSVPPKPPK